MLLLRCVMCCFFVVQCVASLLCNVLLLCYPKCFSIALRASLLTQRAGVSYNFSTLVQYLYSFHCDLSSVSCLQLLLLNRLPRVLHLQCVVGPWHCNVLWVHNTALPTIITYVLICLQIIRRLFSSLLTILRKKLNT